MAKRTVKARERISAAGERVALRLFREADIAIIEPWYGAAAAAVQGLASEDALSIQNLYYQLEAADSDPEAAILAITPRGAASPVGLLEYRLNRPTPGWCTVGFIAIEPARRGYGLGSEAVRAFEEAAEARGLARAFRAAVEPGNGLGFYFWLRLGYRPVSPSDAPDPTPWSRDTMWMVRLLP